MPGKSRISRLFAGLVLGLPLLLVVWTVAEQKYRYWRLKPLNVETISEYVRRFGLHGNVQAYASNGKTYFELRGSNLRGAFNPILVPSGSPACMFDEGQKLVDWSPDTGDDLDYRHKWDGWRNGSLSEDEFRRKFNLK